MRVTVVQGDITDVQADAICTSTNPRLSLMMGSGGAVRERGGFEVLRACEDIVARSGRTMLPAGSVHVTTAGTLPYQAVIHCVASDNTHRSAPNVIEVCVKNALAAADAHGLATIAMPVFGTGHAHVRFDRALRAMAAALQTAKTNVEHVIVVVWDPARVEEAMRAFPPMSSRA